MSSKAMLDKTVKTELPIRGAADEKRAFVRRSPEIKESDKFSTIERFLSVRSINGEIKPARQVTKSRFGQTLPTQEARPVSLLLKSTSR